MGAVDGGPAQQYGYTELRDLSVGRHNIIAVVKFFKPPRKTTGSGFSLFVSVSDPSLRGDKFGITFVNDNPDKLPPVQAPGDVIVVHRLSVSPFSGRLLGYANQNIGSATIVFPGSIESPLIPYNSTFGCSYTNQDLRKVGELREWYDSPYCPLEKEMVPNIEKAPMSRDVGDFVRLHSVRVNSYFNSEAQVVGVYTYATNVTTDLILCLWDGEPAPETRYFPPFYNHLNLERPPPTTGMEVDAHLVCISGHSLQPPESDWSVCVFVFDEHAIAARKLKPGDLVRLYNAHCQLRYYPDRRKVDMHGGGQRYGRRIEVLTEELASKELLDRLHHSKLKRRAINSSSLPADIESLPKMMVTEIFRSSGDPILRVRMCGRIVEVVPSRPEDVHYHLIFKCERCSRSRRLINDKWRNCDCGPTADLTVLPSFALVLEDVSGRLVAAVSTSGIRSLLGPEFDHFCSCLQANLNIADESSSSSTAAAIAGAWSACVGSWVDAALSLLRSVSTGDVVMSYLHD